jgi:flagellar L-ring protein precursor FlgH
MKKTLLTLTLLFALPGCAVENRPMPEPIMTNPNAVEAEPVNNPASLYEAGQSDFLFDDNRANKVGDIVMVLVTETTNGKHKSDTTAQKQNDTAIGVTAFPGNGLVGAVGKTFGLSANPKIGATSSSKFTSTGETKQETAVTATVAARVIRMLPGKVMQVEGARQIRVNAENQILVVRGLVRQRDIDSKNTVPSSALADAKIEVYGQGMLSDKQRGGWLSRMLDNVWPF